MLAKDKVRKRYLILRKKKYFQINEKFFNPFLNFIRNKRIKSVSVYYPSNYELDTLVLLKIFNKMKNLSLSLPIITSKGKMRFVIWKPNDPLKVNRYGFLEPVNKKKITYPRIILVPLLAYDSNKNRLGYGAGYYDRFINNQQKKNSGIITIGLAFSFQKYKKIPISKFDKKLDYILTEKGMF